MLQRCTVFFSFFALVSCATVQPRQPQLSPPVVKIYKVPRGDYCDVQISVANRYSWDIEMSYIDIAVTDSSGRIIGRTKGTPPSHIYQAGLTTAIDRFIDESCQEISGLKIYSLVFSKVGGMLYTWNDKYQLELIGLRLAP